MPTCAALPVLFCGTKQDHFHWVVGNFCVIFAFSVQVSVQEVQADSVHCLYAFRLTLKGMLLLIIAET